MNPRLLAAVAACLLMGAGLSHGQTVVELMSGPPETTIPPTGSVWHTLLPDADFCSEHIQETYEDNGDGEVSAGDYITLTGERFLVARRCFLYHLHALEGNPSPAPDVVAESENPLFIPVFCVVNHITIPPLMYCAWLHYAIHEDKNGNGIVDVGDELVTDEDLPGDWRIENITLGIEIVPETGVGDEEQPSTWSRIKRFLGLS